MNYLGNFVCIWILPWPRYYQQNLWIWTIWESDWIPALDSKPFSEFVMIWSSILVVFLVMCVYLFKVGIRPCRNIKFTKFWTDLYSLKSRALILNYPININSLLVIYRFEKMFLNDFLAHSDRHHWVVDKLSLKQNSSTCC